MSKNLKRNIRLFSIMGVVLVIGVAGYFWFSSARYGPTYHLDNGIAVSPEAVPRTDLAEALDVNIWKFNIAMPDDRHLCWLDLNEYHHGKFVRSLAAGGIGPIPHDNLVTLSLLPIGGDLDTAKQVRFVLNGPSSVVSGFFPNPLSACAQQANAISVSDVDNRIYLLSGGKQATNPGGSNDIDIAIDMKIGPLLHK